MLSMVFGTALPSISRDADRLKDGFSGKGDIKTKTNILNASSVLFLFSKQLVTVRFESHL